MIEKSGAEGDFAKTLWVGGAAVAVFSLLIGIVLGSLWASDSATSDQIPDPPAPEIPDPLVSIEETGRGLAKRYESSVVSLDVTTKGSTGGRRRGTGVIVSTNGDILTSLHLVDDAVTVSAQLADGRNALATIKRRFKDNDLAILKVSLEKLQAIRWGDSDQVKVGNIVWAVGNPFGLQNSLSMGIVSGLNRAGITNNPSEVFLQTDTAMHPGNSGGPLINRQGEVIGINTAILGDKYQGVAFAIPSNLARQVIGESGPVESWVGVVVGDSNRPGETVVVSTPPKNGTISPAAAAGLRKGDVILEINGRKIDSPTQARTLIAGAAAKSSLEFKIQRGGETQIVSVRVAED